MGLRPLLLWARAGLRGGGNFPGIKSRARGFIPILTFLHRGGRKFLITIRVVLSRWRSAAYSAHVIPALHWV